MEHTDVMKRTDAMNECLWWFYGACFAFWNLIRKKVIRVGNDMMVSRWWQNVYFFGWPNPSIIIKHVWMILHIPFKRILQRQWVSWHTRGDVRLKLSLQSICGITDQYGIETTMMRHYWTSLTCYIDSQLELGQTPSMGGLMLCMHMPINE